MTSLYERNIRREALASTYLQSQTEILLALPSEFQANQSYPILLLHDGHDYFQLGRLITQVNQLLMNKQIVPIITVALPISKKLRTNHYSPQGKFHLQHLQFVAHEVFPLLKQRYQPNLSNDQVVIGGSSLGATSSLHFALTYPDLCRRVLAQSGFFSEITIEHIHLTKDLSNLEIYQSIGQSETAVPTHLGQLDLVTRNREVYEALSQKEATVHFVEQEGAHTWGLWQKDLPQALRTFFGR